MAVGECQSHRTASRMFDTHVYIYRDRSFVLPLPLTQTGAIALPLSLGYDKYQGVSILFRHEHRKNFLLEIQNIQQNPRYVLDPQHGFFAKTQA